MSESLCVRDLQVSYGRKSVVSGISFEVNPGEIVAVIGGNGVGKSTMLGAVATVLPFTGFIGFGDASGASLLRKHVGYVPTYPMFPPRLTVVEVLHYYGWLRRMPRAHVQKRVEDVIEISQLESSCDVRASTLSTGMAKRLALGLAVLDEPSVLVLDELTSGVDEKHRKPLLEIARENPVVLMATHNRDEVESLASHILLIVSGRIQEFARLSDDPASKKKEVADFFAPL